MAEFRGRDLHLVKKALAIAVLSIDRMLGPFQSRSDMTDMKGLVDQLIESDVSSSIMRVPRASQSREKRRSDRGTQCDA